MANCFLVLLISFMFCRYGVAEDGPSENWPASRFPVTRWPYINTNRDYKIDISSANNALDVYRILKDAAIRGPEQTAILAIEQFHSPHLGVGPNYKKGTTIDSEQKNIDLFKFPFGVDSDMKGTADVAGDELLYRRFINQTDEDMANAMALNESSDRPRLDFPLIGTAEILTFDDFTVEKYPALNIALYRGGLIMLRPLLIGSTEERFATQDTFNSAVKAITESSVLSKLGLGPDVFAVYWKSETPAEKANGQWYGAIEIPQIPSEIPNFTLKTLIQLEKSLSVELTSEHLSELSFFYDLDPSAADEKNYPEIETRMRAFMSRVTVLIEYATGRTDFIHFLEDGSIMTLEDEYFGLHFALYNKRQAIIDYEVPLNAPFGRYTLLRVFILNQLLQNEKPSLASEYLDFLASFNRPAWEALGNLYFEINSPLMSRWRNRAEGEENLIKEFWDEIQVRLGSRLMSLLKQLNQDNSSESCRASIKLELVPTNLNKPVK